MRDRRRRPAGGATARILVLVFSSGGLLWCAQAFQGLSLPSVGDGAAEGLFGFLHQMSTGGKGIAGLFPAFAGTLFFLVLLAVALYHELVLLLMHGGPRPWRHRLGRGVVTAPPLVIFVYVVSKWLAVFLSLLLVCFLAALVYSALKGARWPGRTPPAASRSGSGADADRH